MKIFLLDLWHDLRAKRLWPVAVVLGVALVAVPVVLSKPSETPSAPPATARKAPDPKDLKALASVKLEQTDERGSSLDMFDPSDPFRPPKKVTKRSNQDGDVASTLEAAGEGKCKPSGSECAFLYIGAGSEHEFTKEEGDSYTLRINEIRKVKVDGTAAASRKKSASAAIGSPAPRRRFASPLLADLLSVSNGGDADSTDHQDRR